MKKIMVLSILGLLALSCKKDLPVDNPSKTVSFTTISGGRTVTPPASKIRVFQTDIDLKDLDQFTITKSTFNFTTEGFLANDLQNLRLEVKNSDSVTVMPLTIIYASVVNGTYSVPINLSKNKRYKLSVYVDAINNPKGKLTTNMNFDYVWTESNNQKFSNSGNQAGETITFMVPTLGTIIDEGNPATRLILAGQSDTTLSIRFTAFGESSTIEKISVKSDVPAMVDAIKVYNGSTMVGSATNISSTTDISVNIDAPKDVSKLLTVFTTYKKITDGNRPAVRTSISSIKYKTSSNLIKSNDTLRTGNIMYLVNSYLKVELIPITGLRIVDSVMMPIAHIRVSAYGADATWKQNALDIAFGDQGTINSLRLTNFKFYEGTTNRTSEVKNFNASGNIDSVYTKSHTKLYTSWFGGNNEDKITVGNSKDYWWWARPEGFTTNDGDVIKITMPGDPDGLMEYNWLTSSNGQLAKLRNASGTMQNFNFILSDLSAGQAHVANVNLGSKDFLHSRYIQMFGSVQILSQ